MHISALRLDLNLPAFRVDGWIGDRLVRSFGVGIGARHAPTPTGRHLLRAITWNPGGSAGGGDGEHPAGRRPAGRDRVRLELGGGLSIRGVPDLTCAGRAASSVCPVMRDDDAIALARLVHSWASEVTAAALDTLVHDPERRHAFDLPRTVPVTLRYDLVEVRAGRLLSYPDVYGAGKEARRALAVNLLERVGGEGIAVDELRLTELLRRGGDRFTSIPLDELLAPGAPVVGEEWSEGAGGDRRTPRRLAALPTP